MRRGSILNRLAIVGLLALLGCSGLVHRDVSSPSAAEFLPGADPESIAALRIGDAADDRVDLDNLYANEAYWPYQIQLTREWKPAGREGDFAWGLGVLLRVDPDQRLRVDFGHHGKHWVPAEATDVLARANALREGATRKLGPNLVTAIGNRLLDPSGETLRPVTTDLKAQWAFLLAIADPADPGFGDLARALEGPAIREGLTVVLVSPVDYGDFKLYRVCYDQRWPGAFLRDRFGPAYAEGALEVGEEPPRLQLLTPEGRLLWTAPATPAAIEPLSALLERIRPRES
jgi:hypothetical protein